MRARRWLSAVGLTFFALAALGSGKRGDTKGDGVALLATTKSSYVGNWEGLGVALRIAPDGTVGYERKTGAVKKTINGKLTRFDGDDIVVNALINVTLKVGAPPAEANGTWTMTVEGVKVHRTGDGSGESNDIDEKLEEHILEQFGASKGLSSVDCPEVEPSTPTFDCVAKLVNGKSAKVSVAHKSRGNYSYTVHVTDVEGPTFAGEMSKTISAETKRKITVDCGAGKSFFPNGEPLVCDATEGRKRGKAEFVITESGVSWKLTGL